MLRVVEGVDHAVLNQIKICYLQVGLGDTDSEIMHCNYCTKPCTLKKFLW